MTLLAMCWQGLFSFCQSHLQTDSSTIEAAPQIEHPDEALIPDIRAPKLSGRIWIRFAVLFPFDEQPKQHQRIQEAELLYLCHTYRIIPIADR